VSAVVRPLAGTRASGSDARIILALAGVTIASQFFRASTSALAPELIHDLGLSPEALGLANAAYRAAFAVIALSLAAGLALYGFFYTKPGTR